MCMHLSISVLPVCRHASITRFYDPYSLRVRPSWVRIVMRNSSRVAVQRAFQKFNRAFVALSYQESVRFYDVL